MEFCIIIPVSFLKFLKQQNYQVSSFVYLCVHLQKKLLEFFHKELSLIVLNKALIQMLVRNIIICFLRDCVTE